MNRTEKFRYELAPYIYLLIGIYVVFTANPLGQVFATLLSLVSLWIIYKRLAYRGYLGSKQQVTIHDFNFTSLAVVDTVSTSQSNRTLRDNSQPVWTFSSGIDGYTVDE